MIWDKLHGQALDAVFNALTESDIPWLVLRNHKGLPWQNMSKDIDIGIQQHRLSEAEIVVENVVKKFGFDRRETTVFQWGRCTSYFGIVEGAAASIKIDLMDGFSWRTAALFDAKRLLQHAVPYEGFLIPAPTDDATIMWLKPLMTGGFVKEVYVPGIAAGISSDPVGFRSNLDRLFRKDLANLIWRYLERGEYQALTSYRRRLSWNAWARQVCAHPLQSIKNASSYIYWELLRRSKRPQATFLAVLGPDGVGKTTFINRLSERLAMLQAKDLESIEIRHFRPHIFPNINQLLTGKAETVSEINNPHSAPPAGQGSSILRIGYYSLDYIFGFWLQTRRRIIRGRTIIFDRYFYDFIVDPRRSRISIPGWAVKAFLILIPKPDIVFVLDAKPDVIHNRKQELPLDEIKRQLAAYQKLVDEDRTRFICIDASQSTETMVDVALREVVTRSYRKI